MIEIELTESQRRADELIMQGHNILLLGKPGTGKTEFLRYIIEKYKANGKKVLATGSTGLAVSNFAGGKTIHNVIKFWPGGKDYDYNECAEELFGMVNATIYKMVGDVSPEEMGGAFLTKNLGYYLFVLGAIGLIVAGIAGIVQNKRV